MLTCIIMQLKTSEKAICKLLKVQGPYQLAPLYFSKPNDRKGLSQHLFRKKKEKHEKATEVIGVLLMLF